VWVVNHESAQTKRERRLLEDQVIGITARFIVITLDAYDCGLVVAIQGEERSGIGALARDGLSRAR